MNAESWDLLLRVGLLTTFKLSLLSILISLALGTLIGVLRVSPIAPLRVLAAGYVEFFRNIPLLICFAFIYYGLPKAGITFPTFESGVIGLSVYTAAFVAEVVRAGLQSISHGQVEAARAIGLSYLQMLRLVLLPQVFRMVMPPLGTVFIALVKNSSVASAIVVQEMMYQAEVIAGRYFYPNVFLIAGLLYLIITVPLAGLVNLAEQRLRIAGRGSHA
ncbi:MAG: amino acid ABC transporter permease [Chloroflexi bacterium]|nr:amino acid ABC transporter permease [Chloroflexota bacterium]